MLAEHGSVSALQIAGQADERVSPRKTGEVRYDLCTKILCTNHRKAGPCFNQSEDQFTPGFLPDVGPVGRSEATQKLGCFGIF